MDTARSPIGGESGESDARAQSASEGWGPLRDPGARKGFLAVDLVLARYMYLP